MLNAALRLLKVKNKTYLSLSVLTTKTVVPYITYTDVPLGP